MRHFVTVLLLACSALSAQRTFIVDINNGAGAHFTDLPAALAQAQHQDVFILLPGTYSAASTDKGVSLVGASTGVVVGGGGNTSAMTVSNLPAGRVFTARLIHFAADALAFASSNCTGRIHLDTCMASSGGNYAMLLAQSRLVSLSVTHVARTVRAVDSTLVVEQGSIVGRGAFAAQGALPALELERGEVTLFQVVINGGFASGQAPAAAIRASTSQLWLHALGAGGMTVDAGTCLGTCPTGASACELTNSTMRYSPDVAFTASLGAPVFALTGSAQAIAVALPTLGAADLGNVLAFTFASAPGSAFAVVLSVPANPVAYASSLFFLDPAVWLTIGSGSQGPTGATDFAVPLPPNQRYGGAAFALQGAALPAVGALALSNAAFLVLQ